MRRFLAGVVAAVVAVTGVWFVAQSQSQRSVEHPTLGAGQTLGQLAAVLCPQNPAAALADLQESNGNNRGSVKHYHPDACQGTQPTTTQAQTTTTTTVAPTTAPTTSTSPSTTVAPSTSTTVAPSSSTSSSTTTSSTTSTTTTSTSTSTTVAPTTTSGGGGGQSFSASFATAGDFYNRFWTYTGNYCEPGQTCRPCERNVGVCQYQGDHSMACEVPTTQRTVHPDVHNENFWWCAPNGPDTGHAMVAMNVSGYGITGFAPSTAQTDITSICWDQNLTDMGGGKWFVVSVVPAPVFTSHANLNPRRAAELEGPYRMDYTLPEFDDPGGPGGFNLQRQQRFQFKVFKSELSMHDRSGQFASSQPHGVDWKVFGGLNAGANVATRYRHCLTETANGIQVTQAGQTWQTNLRFPDGPAYVIFADDTYDADKHRGDGNVLFTWHIDNILIEIGA